MVPDCINATYIGEELMLQGETALIRDGVTPKLCLAQFDKQPLMHGGKNLSSGWHIFRRNEFRADEMPPDTEVTYSVGNGIQIKIDLLDEDFIKSLHKAYPPKCDGDHGLPECDDPECWHK